MVWLSMLANILAQNEVLQDLEGNLYVWRREELVRIYGTDTIDRFAIGPRCPLMDSLKNRVYQIMWGASINVRR